MMLHGRAMFLLLLVAVHPCTAFSIRRDNPITIAKSYNYRDTTRFNLTATESNEHKTYSSTRNSTQKNIISSVFTSSETLFKPDIIQEKSVGLSECCLENRDDVVVEINGSLSRSRSSFKSPTVRKFRYFNVLNAQNNLTSNVRLYSSLFSDHGSGNLVFHEFPRMSNISKLSNSKTRTKFRKRSLFDAINPDGSYKDAISGNYFDLNLNNSQSIDKILTNIPAPRHYVGHYLKLRNNNYNMPPEALGKFQGKNPNFVSRKKVPGSRAGISEFDRNSQAPRTEMNKTLINRRSCCNHSLFNSIASMRPKDNELLTQTVIRQQSAIMRSKNFSQNLENSNRFYETTKNQVNHGIHEKDSSLNKIPEKFHHPFSSLMSNEIKFNKTNAIEVLLNLKSSKNTTQPSRVKETHEVLDSIDNFHHTAKSQNMLTRTERLNSGPLLTAPENIDQFSKFEENFGPFSAVDENLVRFSTEQENNGHRRSLFDEVLAEMQLSSSSSGSASPSGPEEAGLVRSTPDAEVSPGLFEGDIALESAEDEAVLKVSGNWDMFPDKRWPNGVVPYAVSPQYTPEERLMIDTAINTLNFLSCVKLVPWDGRSEDYLFILSVPDPSGCWSYVGRKGGQQIVGLQQADARSRRCFVSLGKPLHELLHALGVYHEHTRADRDNYVAVLHHNIMPYSESNFRKQSLLQTSYAFKYDYNSVMHYGTHYFSKDGVSPTILPLVPSVSIGQREMLSKRDCLKLNAMYGCIGRHVHLRIQNPLPKICSRFEKKNSL